MVLQRRLAGWPQPDVLEYQRWQLRRTSSTLSDDRTARQTARQLRLGLVCRTVDPVPSDVMKSVRFGSVPAGHDRQKSAKDGRINPRDDILQKLFFDKAPSLARDSL